jgi:AcrR family transcriptional regulator
MSKNGRMFRSECRLWSNQAEEQDMTACAIPDNSLFFVRYFPVTTYVRRSALDRSRPDRRVQRTQKLLHEALASLIRERPYDSITVQDILVRANVGRSTFYMHYRDKQELLVQGFQELLHSAYERSRSAGEDTGEILGFSLPMFEHVHKHRHDSRASVDPAIWAVAHEHLRRAIAEMIGDQVNSIGRHRKKGTVQIPADLLTQHVASTFILVLTWWAGGRSRLAPKEVDALFRALIPLI